MELIKEYQDVKFIHKIISLPKTLSFCFERCKASKGKTTENRLCSNPPLSYVPFIYVKKCLWSRAVRYKLLYHVIVWEALLWLQVTFINSPSTRQSEKVHFILLKAASCEKENRYIIKPNTLKRLLFRKYLRPFKSSQSGSKIEHCFVILLFILWSFLPILWYFSLSLQILLEVNRLLLFGKTFNWTECRWLEGSGLRC